MKKIYATFLLLIVSAGLYAQTNDTLTLHFQGTASFYTSGQGFVAGQNEYGDKAKLQLFDINYGVSGPGIITGILMRFGWREGNPNSTITATIWADNVGAPGTILGTVPVTYGSIDTSAAGFHQIMSAVDTVFYNTVAVFPSAITIPANGKFWAGFQFTYAAGDTVGMITTNDPVPDAPGTTGDFPDATTHTFEQWSDNTYNSFNDGTTNTWRLDVALAIFPTVTFGVGINDLQGSNGMTLSQNFPNPFADQTSISYSVSKPGKVTVDVYDIMGEKVLSKDLGFKTTGTHNFILGSATLTSGVYFYTLTSNGGTITRRMTVAK